MARRPTPAASRRPTREELITFIADSPRKIGKREIARAFDIHGDDRIWLKQILKSLEDEGAIDRRHKTVHKAGQLPAVVLADIKRRDRDGELVAEPAEWNVEEDGPVPTILVTLPHRPQRDQPVPGVNDRALIRVSPLRGDVHRYAGRVVKIVARQRAQSLGIFHALPEGGGRVVPVEKKSRDKEISVRPGDENGARDGDLVSVTLSRPTRFGLPQARVQDRLGSVKSEKAISLIAIHTHGIPHAFSKEALAEAENARPASPAGREDWRSLPLVTIDPPDARDHDDAVHAAPDDDPGNPGGFIVTVAIADVAAYVRPGSALDRDALERGNSVYFPDRVVPMLPERISNDLCSLRPLEDRPALAMRMIVDAQGHKRSHSVHRVLMRSAAKLSYAQAQAAVDGRPDDVAAPLLAPVLRPLWAAYGLLKRARDERGPLFLDLPERKIVLHPDGTVDRVFVPERLEAHRLIEEYMILANVAAAETLEKAGVELIYRVHDEPSLEKMKALGEILASIGLKAPTQGVLRASLFNGILQAVEGSENQTFINEVVLRSQSQAAYAAENYGHFGLNLRRYAHFTSPIRRYADLVVHRALVTALKLGPDGLAPDTTRVRLVEISAGISTAERRAMAAERETIDRLIAHHLADRIGATFEGQISGVTKAGLFVKLDETGADGFIPAGTIGTDYYRYEDGSHALRGERTGETYRLGDRVQVKLVEAAPVAGALRFEILSEGRYSKRPHGGKGAAKAKRGPDARAGSRDKARPGGTRVRAKTRRGGAG